MRKYSMRRSLVISAVSNAIIYCVAASIICLCTNLYISNEHYRELGTNLAKTASLNTSANRLNKYCEDWQTDEDYNVFTKCLQDVCAMNSNVRYIYIHRFEPDYLIMMCDSDTDPATYQALGYKEPYPDEFLKYKNDFLSGNDVPPIYSNDPVFGWLVTVSYPITASDGQSFYIMVDMSIKDIIANSLKTTGLMVLSFSMLAVLSAYISQRQTKRSIVDPINGLIYESKKCRNGLNIPEKSKTSARKSHIEEIHKLYDALEAADTQIQSYINELKDARWESEHDGLTGLLNRTAYFKRCDREYKELTSVGAVFCDLNGLKIINDKYGHDEGDKLIIKVAQLLLTLQSDKDDVFRFGGDEFLIIIKNASPNDGEILVNKWLSMMENPDNSRIKNAVAMGFAYASGSFNINAVVTEADKNMYAVKKYMKKL